MFVLFEGIFFFIFGIIAFTAISYFLFSAFRNLDTQNYILQKCTPSTLDQANAFDDVWLRGRISSKEHLTAPHFGNKCVYYHYVKKEQRERTVTDKDGNSKKETYWVTLIDNKQSVNFILNDETSEIVVDPYGAQVEYVDSDSNRIGNYSHSLTYIPYPTELSCAGVVDDNKVDLISAANIPLLITLLDRKTYFEKTEAKEFYFKIGAFVCLFISIELLLITLYRSFIEPGWNYLLTDFTPESLIGISLLINFTTIALFWVIHIFNRLVTLRKRCKNAFAQIDVDLKQRYDLIPNLVEIVKSYQQFEKDLFKSVIDSRRESKDLNDAVETENSNSKEIAQFFALAEAHPELKTETMDTLITQLKNIEDKIAFGRSICNECIEEYNTFTETFPNSIFAKIFKYSKISRFVR